MLLALDVHYRPTPSPARAVVGGVAFHTWDDAITASEHRLENPIVGEYQPGEFYRRELPPLLALLARISHATCK